MKDAISILLQVAFLVNISPALAGDIPLSKNVSVSIPADSTLALVATKEKNADRVLFNGEALVSGMLQIYWQISWNCDGPSGCKEFPRTLGMRFFPDKKSLLSLPTMKEGKTVFEAKSIYLSNNRPGSDAHFPEEKIKTLLKDISNIPDNFFRYRERFVLFPAKIRFAGLAVSKECDSYHFIGTFLEVKENAKELPPDQEREASELPAGCGPSLYDEVFIVRAKNSDKFEVRSSPDVKGAVISRLQNDNAVLNLRTVNNNWLYIRAVPGDEPYSTNKKATPVFGYIYKPSLEMEPLN